MHKNELVLACGALADCMRSLTNLDIDSGGTGHVAAAFEAGRHLLTVFSASEALAALAALEFRFNEHMAFKSRRMEALGWQRGDAAAADAIPIPLGDPQTALVMGQSAAAVLKSILDDPYGSNTAAALGLLLAAVGVCEQRVLVEKKLRHYHEAKTVQVTPACRILCVMFS
jgi:hypothetical protein